MVNDFEQQGYELDQFDFRHSGFELQGNGIAISEIEFELNVSGPTHTLYRRSFRGIARIQWDPEADEGGFTILHRLPSSNSSNSEGREKKDLLPGIG